MSFLDRLIDANRFALDDFLPFFIGAAHVGWIRRQHATRLAEWPDVFACSDLQVNLSGALLASNTDVEARSAAVREVCKILHQRGLFGGWREEFYAVSERFGRELLLLLERASVPLFGVVAHGVHLNGFVRRPDGLHMWIGRRALDKGTAPGELDQVVAGGQQHGLTLFDNLIKECAEEASIDASLARRAQPAGAVSYVLETHVGLRPDVLYCFDLELPEDFAPVNTDGEVETFMLWPIEQVMDVVSNTSDFKFNCALVAIDFFVRHGFIQADHPDYAAIVRGLHGGHATPLPAVR